MIALSRVAKSSKFTFIMLGIGHVNSTYRNDRLIAVSVISDNMRIVTVFLNRVSRSIQIGSVMSSLEILMYMFVLTSISVNVE